MRNDKTLEFSASKDNHSCCKYPLLNAACSYLHRYSRDFLGKQSTAIAQALICQGSTIRTKLAVPEISQREWQLLMGVEGEESSVLQIQVNVGIFGFVWARLFVLM